MLLVIHYILYDILGNIIDYKMHYLMSANTRCNK